MHLETKIIAQNILNVLQFITVNNLNNVSFSIIDLLKLLHMKLNASMAAL